MRIIWSRWLGLLLPKALSVLLPPASGAHIVFWNPGGLGFSSRLKVSHIKCSDITLNILRRDCECKRGHQTDTGRKASIGYHSSASKLRSRVGVIDG